MTERLGVRQRRLLRLMLLHHGGMSGTASRRFTPQGVSLARRGLVTRSATGSVTLTPTGRAAAEELWSLTG